MTQSYQRVRFHITGGRGGNGTASFRRASHIPFGGPDGGSGGDGGDVVIRISESLESLRHLNSKHLVAGGGKDGASQGKTGKKGANAEIWVPLGTKITLANNEKGVVYQGELDKEQGPVIVALGGRGGRGNTAFKSATNQEPLLREAGDRGTTADLTLEQYDTVDVAIIGGTNSGKSSLLAWLTGASPKIAPYPFTTRVLEKGTIDSMREQIVVGEYPSYAGVIDEGIAKHLLKTTASPAVCVMIFDLAAGNMEEQEKCVQAQIADAGWNKVTGTDFIRVFAKGDSQKTTANQADGQKYIETTTFFWSKTDRKEDNKLGQQLIKIIEAKPMNQNKKRTRMYAGIIARGPKKPPKVVRCANQIHIIDDGFERIALLANVADGRVLAQMWRELTKSGITKLIKKTGMKTGDRIVVGTKHLQWE